MNLKENTKEEIVKLNEKIDSWLTEMYLLWRKLLEEMKEEQKNEN